MSEALTAESCREYLKEVIDPEIFQNIVDLGLVYDIKVHNRATDNHEVGDDGAEAKPVVDVFMTLTTPHCPLGPQIIQNVQDVLMAHGAGVVNVTIVWEPMWTPDAMTDELKRELGMLDDEIEPEPIFELPPTPPAPIKKKGFIGRLFGR